MRHFDTSEEIRRGYRVSAQMKKVWAVQLELTRKLLQVCKDHHLKIWADGGTLLGAVREKGYVPWDDDIDMIMPRGDYDKLLGLAAREFRPPFRFQSAYTEDKYPRAHAQLRMDGTTAILSADIFCKFHQGIFIDIFVLDGVPDTRREVRAVEREAAPVMGTLIQYSSWHPAWKFFPHPPRFWRIDRKSVV